jgi:hypothetical protein
MSLRQALVAGATLTVVVAVASALARGAAMPQGSHRHRLPNNVVAGQSTHLGRGGVR